MVQEHWWRDGEVAEGRWRAVQEPEPAAWCRAVIWDGPLGDERSVPIIYEPY